MYRTEKYEQSNLLAKRSQVRAKPQTGPTPLLYARKDGTTQDGIRPKHRIS